MRLTDRQAGKWHQINRVLLGFPAAYRSGTSFPFPFRSLLNISRPSKQAFPTLQPPSVANLRHNVCLVISYVVKGNTMYSWLAGITCQLFSSVALPEYPLAAQVSAGGSGGDKSPPGPALKRAIRSQTLEKSE